MAKKASTKSAAEIAAAKEKAKKAARERFLKVGTARMSKALKAIRNVRNITNPKSYTYTQQEAEKAILALRNELKAVEDAFRDALSGNKAGTAATAFSFA
jgi:hypothetical protein